MKCAQEIKARLTMRDVLAQFGIDAPRSGRIPCPIHHGKDRNCVIRDRSFHCYVCGAGGTVLDFVMQYMDTDLSGAEQILNDRFGLGLPIGREPTRAEQTALERTIRLHRLERERKERELKRLQDAYDAALSEWVRLDSIVSKKAPDGPLDAPDAEWVEAVKKIDAAAQKLSQTEMELAEFERRQS